MAAALNYRWPMSRFLSLGVLVLLLVASSRTANAQAEPTAPTERPESAWLATGLVASVPAVVGFAIFGAVQPELGELQSEFDEIRATSVSATDVCVSTAYGVRDLCSRADRVETLQFAALLGGIVMTGLAVTSFVLYLTGGDGETEDEPTVGFAPAEGGGVLFAAGVF